MISEGRLVLTAAEPLDPILLERVASALGAAPWRRLGAAAAWTPAEPAAVAVARAAIADAPVDANWARPGPRRLFLADMDSTMIGVECVDEIAAEAGVGDDVAAITERAMRGDLDFDAALRARVALLQGFPVARLQSVYEKRVSPNPGAATLLATLKAQGVRTALVSGGFTFFTERVADRLGFDAHHANVLETEDGALTGRVAPPILGREAKAEALSAIAVEIGAEATDAIAVGDGANDLAMVRAAGLGVAYRAKPALAEEADARLEHSDLTAILFLIGLEQTQFVAG